MKRWLVVTGAVTFAVAALMGCSRGNAAADNSEVDTFTLAPYEADGPTTIFFAGTLGGKNDMGYRMITMSEAKDIFAKEGDYIILDVRRADEFAAGHIPHAINVANEDIGDGEIAKLPDKNQVIYVYCRSGNRSKQASAKLAALGYSNIVEFGGILDWTGEVEK